jgi:hypothetical protein
LFLQLLLELLLLGWLLLLRLQLLHKTLQLLLWLMLLRLQLPHKTLQLLLWLMLWLYMLLLSGSWLLLQSLQLL